MPDFLLELGTEEIPARMIDNAYRNLRRAVAGMLVAERLVALPPDKMEEGQMLGYATPRRLAVVMTGIRAAQPDVEEQITGPSYKVAFKDGAPTAAAEAFAKKVGVPVEKLEKLTTPKGEY